MLHNNTNTMPDVLTTFAEGQFIACTPLLQRLLRFYPLVTLPFVMEKLIEVDSLPTVLKENYIYIVRNSTTATVQLHSRFNNADIIEYPYQARKRRDTEKYLIRAELLSPEQSTFFLKCLDETKKKNSLQLKASEEIAKNKARVAEIEKNITGSPEEQCKNKQALIMCALAYHFSTEVSKTEKSNSIKLNFKADAAWFDASKEYLINSNSQCTVTDTIYELIKNMIDNDQKHDTLFFWRSALIRFISPREAELEIKKSLPQLHCIPRASLTNPGQISITYAKKCGDDHQIEKGICGGPEVIHAVISADVDVKRCSIPTITISRHEVDSLANGKCLPDEDRNMANYMRCYQRTGEFTNPSPSFKDESKMLAYPHVMRPGPTEKIKTLQDGQETEREKNEALEQKIRELEKQVTEFKQKTAASSSSANYGRLYTTPSTSSSSSATSRVPSSQENKAAFMKWRFGS